LGTGERKLARIVAQFLADRVAPDITGNLFHLIGRPKNVVVLAHFPESAAVRFAKLKGSSLLEHTDKLTQVGPVVRTLGKNVDMIGHQAKSV